MADYDLGTSNSVDIVTKIRNKKIVTDVLFYSSKEDKMHESIKSAVPILEGFFCVKRATDDFIEKLELLIHRAVRRNQTVENLRGLVMEYSAVYDKHIYDNILRLCQTPSTNTSTLDYINNKIINNIKKRVCRNCRNSVTDKCCGQYLRKEIRDVTELASQEFDMATKCRILSNILQEIDSSKYPNFYKMYDEEIIIYRNAFAHEKSDENRIYIKRIDTFETIDDTLFKKIRGYLTKYNKIFKELIELK